MAKLGIGNPLTSIAQSAIGKSARAVGQAGTDLSTGKNSNPSIVSFIIGSSLTREKDFLKELINASNYGSNLLNVAFKGAERALATLNSMNTAIAASSGQSDASKDALQSSIEKQLKELGNILKTTKFDGRPVLDGSLGKDATVTAAFDYKAPSVKSITGANFLGVGTKEIRRIAVGAGIAADNTITLNGVTFKAVSGAPANETEFKIGVSTSETALNLAKAIQESTDENLKGYEINGDFANARVDITQMSSSGLTDVQLSSNNANLVASIVTAGVNGGLDYSRMNSFEKMIGQVTAKFEFLEDATSTGANGTNNEAGLLAAKYKDPITPVASANARAAAYKATFTGIDDEFTGVIYAANGGNLPANVNGSHLTMVSQKTGEAFTINMAAANTTINIVDAANATTGTTALETLFQQTTLYQTRWLDINKDVGKVYNASGSAIADMSNISATLKSTSFDNKQFTDFEIKNVTGSGNVIFTAKIKDSGGNIQEYTNTIAAAALNTLTEGFKLDLTDAETSEVLSINLGSLGLSSLTDDTNIPAIDKAFKAVFLKEGAGLNIRIGTGLDDQLNVKVPKFSLEELLRDNNGAYQGSLSIKLDADAAIAEEVIQNAIDKVSASMAEIKADIDAVARAAESMSELARVTEDAAKVYTEADMIGKSQEFSENLKKMLASISALQAGSQISDAVRQLLSNL